MSRKAYEFDDFVLDVGQQRLFRNGEKIPLQPKTFDILLVLVEKRGELVGRDELMKAVWKDTFVEETNLRFGIHALRKALGKKPSGEPYVETVPKRGYRLNEEIRERFFEVTAEFAAAEMPSLPPAPRAPEPVEKSPARSLRGRALAKSAAVVLAVAALLAAGWLLLSGRAPAAGSERFGTVAVLPFETAGGEAAEMSRGLAAALAANLARLRPVGVLPPATVREAAARHPDARAAGRALGADFVISGTYRSDAQNALVSVRLSRVADGAALWADEFQAARRTDLEFENEFAARTARRLSSKIADLADERSVAAQKIRPEAAENYLAARKIWRAGELHRRVEMIGLLEKTIALEPNWAPASAALAEALLTTDQLLVDWERAEEFARKAAALDPTLVQPPMIAGEIGYWRDWEWEKSENEFKRALALDPEYAPARAKYARLLMVQRRFAEAEAELLKALESEPFSPLLYCSLCELYTFDKKFDKALDACRYARQIEPDYWRTPKLLYWIYVQKKMNAELGELVLGRLSPEARAAHPLAKALADNDLRPFFRHLIDEPPKSGRENPVTKAMLYVQLGEPERALENLEKALAARDPNLPVVNADPLFDPVRGEKRFGAIMTQVGLLK